MELFDFKTEPSHLVFLAGTIVYIATRLYFQYCCKGQEKSVRKDTLSDWLLVGSVVVGQVVIPLQFLLSPIYDAANYELPAWTIVPGVCLLLSGLWMFWKSHADLGKSWSVTLKMNSTHQLIKHGVYRYIRHPMYAAFYLLSFSQLLLLGNWVAGISGLLGVSLMYLVRCEHEEKMLLEYFGKEYAEYQSQTGRLMPRLWSKTQEAS